MERVGKRREEMGWALDASGRGRVGEAERSDASRNRRRVLAAARALFEERGVTGVTMEEISRAAGVGKGTLYRRFPNKGMLCRALLDEPTRRLQAEILVSLGDPERRPLEKLESFLGRLVLFTEENLDLLYGGQDSLRGAERVAGYDHPSYGWMRWTVNALLNEASRRGELDAGRDVEYLAEALLAPLNVDLYYYQRRILGFDVERISTGLRSLVPGE